MIAWRADEEHALHHISDPWRVSSLIRAFLELIVALCVLLCAIVSVTTTRLIKSLGLLNQTCDSCDTQQHHRMHRRQESDLTGYEKLGDSCDLLRSHGAFGGRYLGDPTTPMSITSEDCLHFLSDCVCTLKRGSSMVDEDSSPRRFCSHGVTSDKNIDNNDHVIHCASDHTIVWAINDDTAYSNRRKQRQGWRCRSSFENIESSYDNASSKPTEIDRSTVSSANGCECRNCMGISPGGGRSPASRRSSDTALKKKFAKVFPNDNSNMARGNGGLCSSWCSDHHSANIFADSTSLIISEGGPDEIRERELDSIDDGLQLVHKDGSSSRSLTDGSATRKNPTRVSPEDSARDSSQESFSHSNSEINKSHSSPIGFFSRYADVSRNELRLSTDKDLLADESCTPEWCGRFASPSPYLAVGNDMEMDTEDDVMEVGSTEQREQDPEIDVMELREALHEEQEALEALYVELEEERNAASSAAHEAMAMITRLQEEKAVIQMQARQYQRIAEEKHQYDQESVAMLQEILVKRDEELYALEEEVSKYRTRLLSLGMDELVDRSTGGRERVGSPKSGDVLFIEWETLLLEGSQDWKHRRDRQDEKLLAEIKDWLHEASEKVIIVPEGIEGLNVLRRSFPKIAVNTDRLLPGNGKKNLLESFCSVAVPPKDGIVVMEDVESDGIKNENFEARTDRVTNEEHDAHRERIANEEVVTSNSVGAPGYEMFQGMMESLGREPSLQDEESLETLKKIEEKFCTRSSEGEVRRSGDELTQIWQNTLRSFESDVLVDPEAPAAEAREDLRKSPTRPTVPANTCDSPHRHAEATDTAVDADRSIGEKRMSVLEYVWKFEEQLHQLGNKKPSLQPTKSGLTTSVAEAHPESSGASLESMDSDKSKKVTFGGDRPIFPIKTPLRKRRAADLRNTTPDAERDRFVVRGAGIPSSERATRNLDARSYKSPYFEESNQDGSPNVDDVYEVPQDLRKTVMEGSSSHFREDKCFRHDIKKYISSTRNELVPGQFIDTHETAHCVEQYLFENGRSGFVAGHTLNGPHTGKGRPDQYCSSGRVIHSVKEPGMCTQAAAILPGEYSDISRETDGCPLQSPSSVVTNSPRTQMQDVVEQLTNKSKALETDRQILQETIASLQRENGEAAILQDISQQLRELQRIEQRAVTDTTLRSADDPGFVSSIKGMLSWDKLRHSVQCQLSKLGQLFLINGSRGGSEGDHQVGLFRLLQKSPLSKQQRPIERARTLKAVYAANSNLSENRVQPIIATQDPLVSQYNWLMNAKERSDTAFRGWDY